MLRSAVPLQQLLRRTRANGGAAALQRILLARLSTSCLPTRRFPIASCRACAVRFTPHLSSSAFSTSSTSSTPDSASPPADPSQPPSTPEPPPSDSSSPPSSLASPDPLSSPTPLTDPLTAELPASEDDPSSSVLDNPSSPYSFYRPPPADPGPPASPDAPWISRPPSYHYPASYPYDPVTDSIPLAPTVEGRSPRDESDEPEFPLPSLPPSFFLLPPPSPSYLGRRAGSFLDVYKHTVLLALTRAHHDAYGPSWTYVGVGGGPVGHDISRSITRADGIDCVYEYGRWWAGLARATHHTTRHTFIPLMHAVRLINGRMQPGPAAAGGAPALSKLDRGFPLYPNNAAVVRSVMRDTDRAVFFEPDEAYRLQLRDYFEQAADDHSLPPLRTQSGTFSTYQRTPPPTASTSVYVGKEHRVLLHPYSPWDVSAEWSALEALGKPMTANALIHIDLTQDRYENFRLQEHLLRTALLPRLFRQFPHATFLTSIPLYGNQTPLDLIRAHVKGGHRDVMLMSHYVQSMGVEDGKREDPPYNPPSVALDVDEPWGVALVVVKPPSGFDGHTTLVQEDVSDVMHHIPHIPSAGVDVDSVLQQEEEDGDVVARTEEEMAWVERYAAYEVDDNALPPFAWLTERYTDKVDTRTSFAFTHSRLKKDHPNPERLWEARVNTFKRSALEGPQEGVRAHYWNEAKLAHVVARGAVDAAPQRVEKKTEEKDGRRKAEGKVTQERGKDARATVTAVDVASANAEVKKDALALQENEAKLLNAWKAEVTKRRLQRTAAASAGAANE